MRVHRTCAAVLAAVLLAPPAAFAQQPDGAPASSDSSKATGSVPDLPVSLERVRRELKAQPPVEEKRDGLRLRYYIEVYGRAPQIQLFTPDDNLVWGPAPYGGMTHQEFLNLITPEEFRSPPADLTALPALIAKWLLERQRKKTPDDSRKP